MRQLIIYSGNYTDPRYLGHIPVKVFKRDGLKKPGKIMSVLSGVLRTSRRACVVSCVDGEVTEMSNWMLDEQGVMKNVSCSD